MHGVVAMHRVTTGARHVPEGVSLHIPRPLGKMDGGGPTRECHRETLLSTCTHARNGGENTSMELDRLFLEHHEQLSSETATEKGAKLADEVKRLTDHETSAAQATAPFTPPHSSEQELAGVEEESGEARQSSGELVQG